MIGTLALASGAIALALWTDHRADRREASAETQCPPEGQIITVNGTQVHALTKGTGPDLILIHGASGSTRDFSFDLIDRLTPHYRVTAFDRPGLGYTDPLPQGHGTPAEQAALLRAASLQLGLKRPLVLGHSYGGAVALVWALEHPEDASGLIIFAGASNRWKGNLGLVYALTSNRASGAALVPLITSFAPDSITESVISAIFAPQDAPEGYASHIGADLTLRRQTIKMNARQVNGLKPFVTEMATRYASISLPVEILHGEVDMIVPLSVHSEPLSRQIPGANLTVLPGVGHMPHHADPEATVAAIHRAATRAGLR